MRRLHALAHLRKGWMDGIGEPINPKCILWVEHILNYIHGMVPEPAIFPTLNGGISVEWIAGERHVDIEFEPDSSEFTLTAFNTKNNTLTERLHCTKPQEIIDFIT